MKKGYRIENEIDFKDIFINVFNFKTDNVVLNISTKYLTLNSTKDDDYVGVWKIKNKN